MSTTYIAEPPKFRSLYIFMNKNAHFIILVSFCRPHSDLLFMTNVPSSLVLLSIYIDSKIYCYILNLYLSNTIVLKLWKVIISYLYLLERKFFSTSIREIRRDLLASRRQYFARNAFRWIYVSLRVLQENT